MRYTHWRGNITVIKPTYSENVFNPLWTPVANRPVHRPSIVDIARDAGVSPATVSRAFNQPDLLRPDTLRRITQVARDNGFRPNRLGSSLRSGNTRTLGLVLPTLSNPVFAQCFEGAERHAHEHGYSVRVATAGYSGTGEAAAVRGLVEHQVDGLLLTVANTARNATLSALAAEGLPFVLAYNESPSHACVAVDNAAAAGDMVRLLADNGHRHIGIVTGPLRASDRARRRLHGARAYARKVGLPQPAHLEMNVHAGVDADVLMAALQQAHSPTALFCTSDLLAAAVISQLAAAGLSVPCDMSVCGFDGMDFAALMVPALTTVHQPCRDIGAGACANLLAQLSGVHTPALRLPHRIVIGQTVASVAGRAPVALRAPAPGQPAPDRVPVRRVVNSGT
jgi:DNA-binding LacI/PurR family transcriptional regulator